MKPAVILLLAFLPLAAQEPKKADTPPVNLEHKLFILKYADPGKLQGLLQVLGANAVPNSELHAIAVQAKAESMPAIEDAIKRLDVPSAVPQNIELTAYYVVGGPDENTPGGPLPKDLDSVATQLKNTFAFKNYRLLDVIELRTRTGQGADTTGSAGVANGLPTATTQFRIASGTVAADGTTIRIDRLKVGVRLPVLAGSFLSGPGGATIPAQYEYRDLGLNADVDIKEGQKVVVGRIGLSKDQALFLVLTARIVN